MLKREQFLVGITTTDRRGGIWREKIKEIKELGLKKAALFPTCFEKEQREEMYKLLGKSGITEIPFVHIRGDMSHEELDYLIKKYNTKVLNIHTKRQHPVFYDYLKYKDMLYLENTCPFNEEELSDFAGLCLDISHLEDERLLRTEEFIERKKIIKKHKIGCNHISAIPKKSHKNENGKDIFSLHSYRNLSDFDYLKNYPKKFFSNYVAMELENSLKEQLKAIDYIVDKL